MVVEGWRSPDRWVVFVGWWCSLGDVRWVVFVGWWCSLGDVRWVLVDWSSDDDLEVVLFE